MPDAENVMRAVDMNFHYRDSFNGTVLPDAYERLLLEALQGDASLFNRSDAIESSWKLVDPVIEGWNEKKIPPLAIYPRGSWGPTEAETLLARDGRHWRLTDPEGKGAIHAGD